MTAMLLLARAIHIGACLLLFTMFAFGRFVAGNIREESKAESRRDSRAGWFNLLFLAIILLSGLAWFVAAGTMMGSQGFNFEVLKTVWMQTQFGTLCKIRLLLWLAAVAISVSYFSKSQSRSHKLIEWALLTLSAGLLGSLAWTGHGREGSIWHLLADVLHLLGAGMWPMGLLPFALLLNQLRHRLEPEKWVSIAMLVRRFSAISLGTVAVLGVTGWVNAWFLLGAPSNLFSQAYGRWLLGKIILFFAAVAIGAVNLLRLKPRLLYMNSQPSFASETLARLRFNVLLELVLGSAIVIIVAVLGILAPSAGG